MLKVWTRELKRIIHHRGLLFLFCLWPFLYALIFGLMYSNEVVTKMPVTLIDLDQSQLSRTLTRFISSSRSFDIQKTSRNPEVARDEILSNQKALVLIIPRDFQKDVKRGKQVQVTAWINASNLLIANLNQAELKTIIGTVAAGVKLKLLQKTGHSKKQAIGLIQGFNFDSAKLHNPGMSYMQYLTPGLWAALLHQIFVLMGALLWVPEIERGRQKELAAMGFSKVLLGKVLFYSMVSCLILELFFRLLYPWFEIHLKTSVASALAFSFFFAFAAISLGALISVSTRSTLNALKAVILITSPAFILSGYTWPQDAMPTFYQYLGNFIPLTPYLTGFRKLYQEGAPWNYIFEQLSILFTLAFSFLGLALYRVSKTRPQEIKAESL